VIFLLYITLFVYPSLIITCLKSSCLLFSSICCVVPV
jgi:hypothetical protein